MDGTGGAEIRNYSIETSYTICPVKEKGIMKTKLLIAIACLILAVVIFVFAEGARRLYSGGFFALIGLVGLYLAAKKKS